MAGDDTRADETVYKIKSEGITVWEILERHSSLAAKYELSKQKVDSLTH